MTNPFANLGSGSLTGKPPFSSPFCGSAPDFGSRSSGGSNIATTSAPAPAPAPVSVFGSPVSFFEPSSTDTASTHAQGNLSPFSFGSCPYSSSPPSVPSPLFQPSCTSPFGSVSAQRIFSTAPSNPVSPFGTTSPTTFDEYGLSFRNADIYPDKVQASSSPLVALFNSKDSFFDVTFSVDSECIYAHKGIISIHIPGIIPLLKASNDVVRISDTSAATFLSIVRFCYTNELDIDSPEHCKELIRLANLWNMKRVKSACGAKLCSTISLENVITLFLLSEEYECKDVRARCIQFIIDNYLEVCIQPAFKELASDVIRELLEKACINLRTRW